MSMPTVKFTKEHKKTLRGMCDNDRFFDDVVKLSVGLELSLERKKEDPTPSKIKRELSTLHKSIRRLSPAAKEYIHAYITNEYFQFMYRGGDINVFQAEHMGNIAFDSFITACRDHENFKKTNAREDLVIQLAFISAVFERVYGLNITTHDKGDFVKIIDILLEASNCKYDPQQVAKDAIAYRRKASIAV
ncbi:MAG: hypothetical protein KUF80_06315 [Candidatus Thiodiazotropha sp. (ex Codakia orbicularis)]|nr:hypothetical protein [Candidatus Thiodiazotropha sp. (ex Codakia orbicularis)]